MELARIQPGRREGADILGDPNEECDQRPADQQRHAAMEAPDLEVDETASKHEKACQKQNRPKVGDIVMPEKVRIDRPGKDQCSPKWRMVRETEIEKPSRARDIATDTSVHKAGEKWHAAYSQ